MTNLVLFILRLVISVLLFRMAIIRKKLRDCAVCGKPVRVWPRPTSGRHSAISANNADDGQRNLTINFISLGSKRNDGANLSGTERAGMVGRDRTSSKYVFFFVLTLSVIVCPAPDLIFYLLERHANTPFDIYVINLLGVNIVCPLPQYQLSIISNLYPDGWHLGGPACILYMYCLGILNAAIIHIYALISISRRWAIVHPISFRMAHANRTTLTICAVMWIYIHVAEGSNWLIDTLHYRYDVRSYGCSFDFWRVLAQVL
ncbi:hypothetical protein BV898_14914 [Hypsibius exemplaris]|uniref:G-protein coupled receptors family 1 profile domain-containing protein n=1 Tax=Hypsibius exemplaris TaxID=2072580 RepID=A0A9X6NAE5_HYPEX|nr:hypothetical protein BV898_14914 [Hypsibius exemplaris]